MSTDLPVLRNFVGGSAVEPTDGMTSAVVDPCTGETYAYAPVSTAVDVAAAMESAESGFELWRDSTPGDYRRRMP